MKREQLEEKLNQFSDARYWVDRFRREDRVEECRAQSETLWQLKDELLAEFERLKDFERVAWCQKMGFLLERGPNFSLADAVDPARVRAIIDQAMEDSRK